MGTTSLITRRLRRHRAWRRTAWAGHGGMATAITGMMAVGPVQAAGIAAVFATITPLLILVWREHRTPSTATPSVFRNRSIGVATTQGAGLWLLVGGAIAWLAAPAAAVALAFPAVAAFRAVRYPLSAELGETDVEIRVRIRTVGLQPSWSSPHSATLTGTDITITAQSSPTRIYQERIPLGDVLDIDIRSADPTDDPWFSFDGFWLATPPGEVMVVRHTKGKRVLPVLHAAEFGAVARARAVAATKTA
ncbi:hypothetical protein [Pseudonocardia sp. TRM90224]|uniref:hypothetical protein n=1 Tax=Pseudonocardia sp. TRM90224 TaxID=2812678 RepID=UPI001E466B17|nr:hypothetical protein [Pseudonocardia sp. TRM90224]